jgi:hypothetical protein
MSADPRLSVIVPAWNGMGVLPTSLPALLASDLPRDAWELVVVDDGSSDGTAGYAAPLADRVVSVAGGPRGPAYARNRGAEVAEGDVLVFIDADVVVHADTLRRFRELFTREPDVVAAFGAYDDDPLHPAFVSQYRNLLHRYVHLRGAGDAETFWAGCGAVRADPFRRAGAFDADAFPRPQIEDIELGYRLREQGGRIVLDPTIQGAHLKRWTLRSVVRTDLFDRGIPWMRLLIRRGRTSPGPGGTLNVRPLEKVKTGLLGLGLATLAAAALLRSVVGALAGGALIATVVALNAPLYAWFAGRRGWPFALGVIPLSLLYHLLNGVSVVIGWAAEGFRRTRNDAVTASSREVA